MGRFLSLVLLLSVSLNAETKSHFIETTATLEIAEGGSATYTLYEKIQVNDELGKDHASFSIFTNEFFQLKKASARIYDAQGKVKKKYKKKHLKEVEASAGGILADGSVYEMLDLSKVVPIPFVVEMEYTVEISSHFFLPDWRPQKNIPVNKATLTIHAQPGQSYRSFNPATGELETISEELKVYQQEDIEAYISESNVPPEFYDKYNILFAPVTFDLDGYTGSMKTWREMGMFYDQLSRDQYALSPGAASDLRLINAQTLRDTIQQVYDYLQMNTRYVGLELGIHGWRPHKAQWVCDNKYGDCKDLATLFIALLRRYDIPAYPALIRTRSSGWVYPEFPSSRFNHVIACVPLADDTLWVDCTYDDGRIDVIPSQDQGCNVLLVNGSYSELVKTPIQVPEKNLYHVDGTVHLRPTGAADIEVDLRYEGHASMRRRSSFQGKTVKEQREYILYLFDESAPGLMLDTFSVSNLNDKYKPLKIHVKGRVPHLATETGSRLFLELALPYALAWRGDHPGRRKASYFGGTPYRSTKTIRVRFDQDLSIESLPKGQSLTSAFGSVQQSFDQDEDGFTYQWDYISGQRIVPHEDYGEYHKFRRAASRANTTPVIIKKR